MVRAMSIELDPDLDLEPVARSVREDFEPADFERRLEDWLVCQLDDADPQATYVDSILRKLDVGLLDQGALRKTKPAKTSSRSESRGEDWMHFRIERFRGVAIVTVSDASLIKEERLRELADELIELVESGYHRLIINFGKVQRLSSQFVAITAEIRRRSEAYDDGGLKVCVPDADAAEILALTGTFAIEEIHRDMKSALEAPWPALEGPRPLPISIIAALTSRGPAMEAGPGQAERTVAAAEHTRRPAIPAEGLAESDEGVPACGFADPEPRVWLIAEVGRRRGHFIPVTGPKFLIGREPGCAIRTETPTVSRVHASIGRRGTDILLRDLGSTNGTLLNGTVIRDRATRLANGDRVQVGPLVFRVAIGLDLLPSGSLEELVASWLNPKGSENASEETVEAPAQSGGEDDERETVGFGKLVVTHEEEAVVVTPRLTDIESEESLTAVRSGLFELFESGASKRVVLNLERVSRISSRGIGILLAHHLRLDRAGGALRMAEVHAHVRSTIERVRLPMLLEAFSSVDEAVLAAWP